MVPFSTLWHNHPVIKDTTPLLDRKVYENQCAVNMSAALIDSGVNLTNFHGVRSWQKDKPKYPIRAQELADWLAKRTSGFTSHQKFKGEEIKNVFDTIDGKTGIIFFQNYWGLNSQGDHIDLWNRSRLSEWMTWFRIHIYGEKYTQSQAIWFWPVP